MSDQVQIAIIAGLSTALPIVIGQWFTHRKVDRVEKATNGMKAALIIAARREGHEQGEKEEKAKH